MTLLGADAFRPFGDADAIANDFVVPYYLDETNERIVALPVLTRHASFWAVAFAFLSISTFSTAPC